MVELGSAKKNVKTKNAPKWPYLRHCICKKRSTVVNVILLVKTGIENGFKTSYGVQFFTMGSRSEREEALRAGGPEGRSPRVVLNRFKYLTELFVHLVKGKRNGSNVELFAC